jgi:rfaE bifunctional protein nucleotidyltransferase chain/domain
MHRPSGASAARILSREALLAELASLRAAGRRVALTNGLFDILHVGHLRHLEAASAEADVLIVGINSDRSARELKGPTRPVIPELERAELVAGFACVDFVTIFDELNVEALIAAVRPDVHCKGTDYTPESVPEAALAARLGVRVAIVGDPKRHATRDIIRRLRDQD